MDNCNYVLKHQRHPRAPKACTFRRQYGSCVEVQNKPIGWLMPLSSDSSRFAVVDNSDPALLTRAPRRARRAFRGPMCQRAMPRLQRTARTGRLIHILVRLTCRSIGCLVPHCRHCCGSWFVSLFGTTSIVSRCALLQDLGCGLAGNVDFVDRGAELCFLEHT